MTYPDDSYATDAVKERFAHLYYHAACVRLEVLVGLLNVIDANGGIEQTPAAVVSQAAAAAADVAQNMRFAQEALSDQIPRRAEPTDAGRLDFPARERGRRVDAPGSGAGGRGLESPKDV